MSSGSSTVSLVAVSTVATVLSSRIRASTTSTRWLSLAFWPRTEVVVVRVLTRKQPSCAATRTADFTARAWAAAGGRPGLLDGSKSEMETNRRSGVWLRACVRA
jgi:hypothetical protein